MVAPVQAFVDAVCVPTMYSMPRCSVVSTLVLRLVMLEEFSSTFCDTVLNVVVSTFSEISDSASVMRVSRLVERVLRDDSSVSVLVMWLDTVSSNDSIEVIFPSASVSLFSACVTSLSLMSCHEYDEPVFVKR